ncbi:MAG: hypothetical protein ABR909_06775 [Candidatus Bathyarchaeia archaeon]|jgi:hypothetical protein
MAALEKDKIVFGLIDRIDNKRKNIQELTSKIMELENNLTEENIVKIKQAINEITYSLACFCPDSERFRVHGFEVSAKHLFSDLRQIDNLTDEVLAAKLDSYCAEVNTFSPMVISFDKKGSNINLTINFNGIKL